MQQFTMGPEEQGCRVDRLLRRRLALMPLSGVYTLIRKGGVCVNGRRIRQDYRIQEGDVLQVDVDQAEISFSSTPDDTLRSLTKTSFYKKNFSIIYEDEHLLACNKPPGLVVHPGSGHQRRDTLIELALAYLLDKNGIARGDEPALVHRLDRDTSGVILIAKNKRTLRALHHAFAEHVVEKEYRAVCHRGPPEYEGTISVNLSRTHERNRGMKMRVDRGGEASSSRYEITGHQNDLSSVTVFLETGKTHQIRVQMAHVGAPVVGDVRYGDAAADAKLFGGPAPRLFLHAFRVVLRHPHTGKPLTVKAPVPEVFTEIMSGRR
jgi:23S rRNA pseudouridine955/2504/2580 synthase